MCRAEKREHSSDKKEKNINPISGRGAFSSTLRILGNISETAGATMLKFSDFSKNKLGTFPSNFKLLALLTVAAPGHRKLWGPNHEASNLGEVHDADVL